MPVLGNIAFQALSMAVLGAFCWMVWAYRGQVVRCLKSTVAFSRATNPRPEAVAVYDGFLATALTLGAMSAGLAVVKAVGMAMENGAVESRLIARAMSMAGAGPSDVLPVWVVPAAVAAVALATAGVVLVEAGILKAAGSLTYSTRFTGEIITVKKNWLAALSIFTVPIVGMWTGVNPERDMVMAYLLAGVMVTLTTLFVVQTLRGFIRQNVSLLVWFLYLCTVEILPVCAVMLAVARNV